MKQKIRIMKTPPPVTDEEMKSLMDFDDLLQKREAAVRNRNRLQRMRYFAVIFVAAIIVPSAWLWWRTQPRPPVVERRSATEPLREPERTQPVADTLDPHAPERDKSPFVDRPEKPAGSPVAGRRANEPDYPTPVKDSASEQPVYVQAEPADGYPALYNYFGRNLRYPPSAVKDSVEGVVNVAFVIDQSGRATQIVIEKSPGMEFDKEVVRLIENMPLWKPASYGGRPVESRISLPVTFSLVRKTNP